MARGSWAAKSATAPRTAGSARRPSACAAIRPTIGYVLNSNLQLNLGWQHLHYDRDIGTFYNGAPRIDMDAAFLHLQFQV